MKKSGASLEQVQGQSQASHGRVCGFILTCPRFVLDLPETCLRLPGDLPETFCDLS